MVQTFRRSLIGYDPKSIEDVLMRLKSEFNKRRKELKEQIAEEIHGLELIKLEIDHVKGINSSFPLRKEISEQLLSAHLGTIESIIKTMKDSEIAEKKAEELFRQKQDELDSLKNDLQKMRQEFLGIAERYKLITDTRKGGD